jgi:hypothetical protein
MRVLPMAEFRKSVDGYYEGKGISLSPERRAELNNPCLMSSPEGTTMCSRPTEITRHNGTLAD